MLLVSRASPPKLHRKQQGGRCLVPIAVSRTRLNRRGHFHLHPRAPPEPRAPPAGSPCRLPTGGASSRPRNPFLAYLPWICLYHVHCFILFQRQNRKRCKLCLNSAPLTRKTSIFMWLVSDSNLWPWACLYRVAFDHEMSVRLLE